jgi:hypothetical protein
MKDIQLDIRTIHSFIVQRTENLNKLNGGIQEAWNEQMILDSFLDVTGLEKNEETRYIAYQRIASLREDGLLNFINKKWFREEQGDWIRAKAFVFVQEYHDKLHRGLIDIIEENDLLTPFYRKLIKWVHFVWWKFHTFHTAWNLKLINWVNRGLETRFWDLEVVMKYLWENDLFDKWHGWEIADRSYSILEQDGDGYRKFAYIDAFPEEIDGIIRELWFLRDSLEWEIDDIYHQKEVYIQYFEALIGALSESSTDMLVDKWARVDEIWMQMQSPFQIVHPLEYYEDKYRKAVAPEWDLRLKNSELFESTVQGNIETMFHHLAIEMEIWDDSPVKIFSLQGLKKVQLYISDPMMYYGSQLWWLPSAQVVPNDAEVSKIHGKKIFSFPESVLKRMRSRPLMKIEEITFSSDILTQRKNLLFGPENWFYALYDIETIGHEFGHTLWLDLDTETRMNMTGNFKNIEEWKATTGWLMAFFQSPTQVLKKDIVTDLIVRSVWLIGWMKQWDVLPYYCEWLIHLKILFDSEIISLDTQGKVVMNYSDEWFEILWRIYKEHYKKLIQTYVTKTDASVFLFEYTIQKNGFFLPKDEKIRDFVEWYYALYEDIWNIIAE